MPTPISSETAKLVTEQLAGGTFGGNRPEVSRAPGYIICERLSECMKETNNLRYTYRQAALCV